MKYVKSPNLKNEYELVGMIVLDKLQPGQWVNFRGEQGRYVGINPRTNVVHIMWRNFGKIRESRKAFLGVRG